MNKKLFKVFLSCIIIFNLHANKMPEPYASIKPLPFYLHGWFGTESQNGLQRIIEKHSPKTIVEVGVWMGKSLIFMGITQKEGVIYAVDHWLGSDEHHINPNWKVFLPTLYIQFLSNIIHCNLTHKVIPMRMSSMEAAACLNIKPDMVYIDAGHDEGNVYNDVTQWYNKMGSGGIICGDDYTWDGVKKGVTKAAGELKLTIHSDKGFWWADPKP